MNRLLRQAREYAVVGDPDGDDGDDGGDVRICPEGDNWKFSAPMTGGARATGDGGTAGLPPSLDFSARGMNQKRQACLQTLWQMQLLSITEFITI